MTKGHQIKTKAPHIMTKGHHIKTKADHIMAKHPTLWQKHTILCQKHIVILYDAIIRQSRLFFIFMQLTNTFLMMGWSHPRYYVSKAKMSLISPWMGDSNTLHNLRSLYPIFFYRRQERVTLKILNPILPFPDVYLFVSMFSNRKSAQHNITRTNE